MGLQAPTKLQKPQQALHAKAKESPDFRFYALYDKIYREDILAHAYRLARSNCCRRTDQQAMDAMRAMMDSLRLTVNEAKTGRCRLPQAHFDFLGYTFERCYSMQTGRAYIGTRPSKKSIQKVYRTVSEATSRRWLLSDSEDRVTALNRILVGWANYFCLGPVSKAYRAVDRHATERLRRWLCKKHKRPGQGTARFPDAHLHDVLGLQRLSVRPRDFPWAKA